MCSVRRNLDGLSPRLYLPVFAESVWKCCTVLSCTRTTLTPTRPPTQTCLGTHIDCSVPSEHMHAETPTQSSYEPSHLMFMHQPQSRLGKLLCGIISNLLPLYVGSEYVNGRWFLIPMCASSGWKWRCSALGVCACVLYAEMCPCELTGTLGSDTAMLSGYTVAFTHWSREAAKRYGSSARSQRLLWEQLDGEEKEGQRQTGVNDVSEAYQKY